MLVLLTATVHSFRLQSTMKLKEETYIKLKDEEEECPIAYTHTQYTEKGHIQTDIQREIQSANGNIMVQG